MSKFKAEVKRCKKTIFDTRANWTYLNKNLSYRYVVALKRAEGKRPWRGPEGPWKGPKRGFEEEWKCDHYHFVDQISAIESENKEISMKGILLTSRLPFRRYVRPFWTSHPVSVEFIWIYLKLNEDLQCSFFCALLQDISLLDWKDSDYMSVSM